MAANGFFKPLKENVSSALLDVTRTGGKIAAEDLAFQRSSNPAITPLLDKQNQRLLHLVHKLTQVSTAGTDVKPSSISDVDSLEDKWHGLVDIFDNLLEKADACLDEYTGVIRKGKPSQQPNDSVPTRKAHPPQKYRSQILLKPQLLFEQPPQNHETTPFKPLLRSKPHSIQPLEVRIQQESVEDESKQYDTRFSLSRQSGSDLKSMINITSDMTTHTRLKLKPFGIPPLFIGTMRLYPFSPWSLQLRLLWIPPRPSHLCYKN